MSPPVRASKRAVAVATSALILLSLCGCAGVSEQLASAASDASSAVATARLATTQRAGDRTFLPTTQTALSDALKELSDAEASASAVDASNAHDAATQKRTLTAIRGGVDAVISAQRTAATHAGEGLPGLARSARELRSLSDALEKATR